MTISTLKPQSRRNYSTLIYIILFILAGVLFFVFGRGLVDKITNLRGKSTLIIKTEPDKAKIFIDDEFIGESPLTNEDIKPGEHKISVRSDSNNYETSILFIPNAQVTLTRNLGVSPTFSSGGNVWFEQKNGTTILRVVSDPDQASVFVDGTEVGKTPFSSTSITAGDYDIKIEKPGYRPASQRVKISTDATLNLAFTLFPIPVPSKVSLLKGSQTIYDLSVENQIVTTDPAQWAEAVVYWNSLEGINLAGIGVNKEPVFDFFVDYRGSLYDNAGAPVPADNVKNLKDLKKGGYLGRLSDTPGLTPEAKDALAQLNVSSEKMAKVLDTGTGWLRVRDEPNVAGAEIARVNVGESYPVLEEGQGWVKIKVSDSIPEGWVSGTYVDVLGGEESTPEEDADSAADTEDTPTQ
jgi:hypothetical protein